jgi:hypothetical protein
MIWGGWNDGTFFNSRGIYTNPAVIGILNQNKYILSEFSLFQNYPNPFNPSTTIQFELPRSSYTKLTIYDVMGREVVVLVNEELKAGTYKVYFDGSNFSSGLYFIN